LRSTSAKAGAALEERAIANALGSARETVACLDVANALGYVSRVDAALLDQLDHVRATLLVNVR
jgi:flavin-binding protein dodecin